MNNFIIEKITIQTLNEIAYSHHRLTCKSVCGYFLTFVLQWLHWIYPPLRFSKAQCTTKQRKSLNGIFKPTQFSLRDGFFLSLVGIRFMKHLKYRVGSLVETELSVDKKNIVPFNEPNVIHQTQRYWDTYTHTHTHIHK